MGALPLVSRCFALRVGGGGGPLLVLPSVVFELVLALSRKLLGLLDDLFLVAIATELSDCLPPL